MLLAGLLHNNETLQQLQTLHVLHVNFATVPGTKPAVLQTNMKRATLMETLKLPSIPEDLGMSNQLGNFGSRLKCEACRCIL
jgi:hypothetical protein